MFAFFAWYLTISAVGWVTFPITYRYFKALSDRGYIFSRTLGLLLWAYAFWLLASLQLIPNSLGGILLPLIGLIIFSGWSLRGGMLAEITNWIKERGKFLVLVEALFLAAFAFMTIVRAANPEIMGTEKPMELAFINAILSSPNFPPHDPWLSGYAISYYYFGYVIVAMLAKFTGITGNIAFNLGVALVFGLTALGSYGIVYNLLRKLSEKHNDLSGIRGAGQALFGPLFILLVSNVEGFLEVLHAKGLFWAQSATGELTSNFWQWLDMRELSQPPTEPFSWMPSRFLWWWRASRVLQDYDFARNWKEVIDEFPVFSYILSDLHPHVLAMPFAFLAIALALNLFYGGGRGKIKRLNLDLDGGTLLLAGLVLGGMAFLNTWDFPFYLALFSGAYIIAKLKKGSEIAATDVESERDDFWIYPLLGMAVDFIKLSLVIGISGFVLYLPFYVGFSSQAGGILPNLTYPTRGAHLWVMFATLLLPILGYLLYLWRGGNGNIEWKGFLVAGGLTLGLMGTSLLLTQGILLIPEARVAFLDSLKAPGGSELIQEAFVRRLSSPGGWISLLALLGLVLSLLWGRVTATQNANHSRQGASAHEFVLLLVLLGTLLVYGPEFVYLRDFFGYRINTIFKFYYQAWLLWGTAAAFGVAVLLQKSKGIWGIISWSGLSILLVVGLTYTVLGFWTKTSGFQPPGGYSLDGTAYIERGSADEFAAVTWLQEAPPGVVAEAVGGSYSPYGRISMLSGKPTVLGWDFHEFQWRGGGELQGSRMGDIQRLYCTNDWGEAQAIIDLYDIRYVFIGNLERGAYTKEKCSGGLNELKFQRNLIKTFEQGSASIYAVP